MKRKILLLIIILLGLSLRLFKLGYHDLWYDEAVSILSSYDHSYIKLWNPPFFYSILHFWIKLFGQSEFSVRLPALIFSTLSIPLIFLLGKKLFNPKVGIFAATIMAFSPMQIWYAQEARAYSAILLFSITSTYFLLMIIKGKPKYWLYFIISSILGLYSGEFYFFLLIGHLVLLITRIIFAPNKNKVRSFLLSLVFICLCLLPWFGRYLHKFNYIKRGFWIPRPDVFSLIITFENFLVGYNLSQKYYFIANFLILVLLFAAFKSIYNKDIRNNFYICLFLMAFPILSIYIFSKLIVSIYLDRALLIFSPYFYILLAIGMNKLSKKKTGLFVCLCLYFLLVIGIRAFYQDYMPTPYKHHVGTFIKKPIKPLVKFIEKNSKPEDIIAFTCHSTPYSFFLYTNNKLRKYYEFFDPKLPGTDSNRPIEEDEYHVPKEKISLLKAKRIWLIASNFSHDGGLDKQSESVKKYLDKEMILRLAKNIHGVWVYLYEHK